MAFTLNTLPQLPKEHFLQSYSLANGKEYRGPKGQGGGASREDGTNSLFKVEIIPKINTLPVIWATDNYLKLDPAHCFNSPILEKQLGVIIPRVEKTKLEQKKRVKEKAEVFTPSWVCNKQNNLIDDAILYEHAFNSENISRKNWAPNPNPINFSTDYSWVQYISEKRLEMTAGEAPYLVSPYDTVTGAHIKIRTVDRMGKWLWHRIGILDRKLRVITENVDNEEGWKIAALYAFKATYGYEWQGDSLLLARLNLLNTYCDYYQEVWNKEPLLEDIEEVSEIISWNVWQMDGLKMVVPESCSAECEACKSKAYTNHDGLVSLIKWGNTLKTFEELLETH
jgi:hypothetical protein